jgi:hypothetical protein
MVPVSISKACDYSDTHLGIAMAVRQRLSHQINIGYRFICDSASPPVRAPAWPRHHHVLETSIVKSGGTPLAQRIVIFVASALVALVIAAQSTVIAQTCSELGTELSRLRSGLPAANASKAANYQQEWIEQSGALSRERSRARQANCSGRGFLFFRSKPQPECRQILPRLRKLQANVARLDSLRRQNPGGGSDRDRIAQVRTIMLQNNCFDDFQMDSFRNRADFEAFFNGEFDLEMVPGYTFRTLCVRACDGYYFPISFSTTREQFAYDQATCEAMCPGARVELYYHDNPASASENMISLYGVPYEDHPAAFQYRSKYDKSCSCGSNRPPLFSVAGKLRLSDANGALSLANSDSAGRTASVPVPVAKPGLGEDPETTINRAGDFQISAFTSLAGASRSTMRNGRPVRIVGPVHWSAQEKEEAVLIPVPN